MFLHWISRRLTDCLYMRMPAKKVSRLDVPLFFFLADSDNVIVTNAKLSEICVGETVYFPGLFMQGGWIASCEVFQGGKNSFQ